MIEVVPFTIKCFNCGSESMDPSGCMFDGAAIFKLVLPPGWGIQPTRITAVDGTFPRFSLSFGCPNCSKNLCSKPIEFNAAQAS